VTAALALVDMQAYSTQLESLFPMSGTVYPADSLRQLRATRAAEWITRLRALPSSQQHGVSGWQLVPFAQVAVVAGNDSLAARLFETRLAQLSTSPAERAYVLAAAIRAFADLAQDSARLAHRLALAERYDAQLRTIPAAGYPTVQDSFSVFLRQMRAEDTLVAAYGALQSPAQLRAHAEWEMMMVTRIAPNERADYLDHLYRPTALALGLDCSSRTELETWREHFVTAMKTVSSRGGESGAAFSVAVRSIVASTDSSLRMIGSVAAPISAHLWLNTPDSLYQPTLRTRSFGDGTIHVLLFSDIGDVPATLALQHLHQAFPHRVEGLLVTHTTGNTGPDLAAAADETTWIKAYTVGLQHFTFPMAIWAGPKLSYELPEGKIGERPQEWPLDTSAYRFRARSYVLIDGAGVIRAVDDAMTRFQEARLWRRVRALVAEPSHAAGPN